MGTNLVLIGHRATGKSAVAKELARLLPRFPSLAARIPPLWFDTDSMIEHRCGRSIDQIFHGDGEPYFRDRETELLRDLSTRQMGVIATGGGAPIRAENQEYLRRMGTIIWLTASAKTIAQRLDCDPNTQRNRPKLQIEEEYAKNVKEIEKIGGAAGIGRMANSEETHQREVEAVQFVLRQREPIYRALADETICSEDASPETIANAILTTLEN